MARHALPHLASVDLRSLVLLRVGLALGVLASLAERAPYLIAQYSDVGGFTRAQCAATTPSAAWLFAPHFLSGDPWWQGALFALTAVAAVALLIGYRAQLACALCWLLGAGPTAARTTTTSAQRLRSRGRRRHARPHNGTHAAGLLHAPAA